MEVVEPRWGLDYVVRFDDTSHLIASVCCGILMCKIVYDVTGTATALCFKGYGKLTDVQKLEWKNRGISTFHAILVAAGSFYLLLLSDLYSEASEDVLLVNRSSFLSNSLLGATVHVAVAFMSFLFFACSTFMFAARRAIIHFMMDGISVGYFLSDLAMILWCYPALGGMEYVLHHGLSMFSIVLSLISGQAQFYILMVLFTESTTPSINLRWYLDVAGQKNSKLYLYNGVAVFLIWLVARILLFVYFFAHLFLHFDQVKQMIPLCYYSMLVVPPILTVMNLFWFWKILKGLIKTVTKTRHSE